MNASTAHSTRPAPTHTVTLLDTSNSDTIHDVGIQDETTGPHTRSTTSTWNGGSQRELTVKELSGKRGAHQPGGQGWSRRRPDRWLPPYPRGGVRQPPRRPATLQQPLPRRRGSPRP